MAAHVNRHQLAICRELLHSLEQQRNRISKGNVRERTQMENRIRTVRDRITKLGCQGSLKMAIVAVMHGSGPYTETYFAQDLDEESMRQLITARIEFKTGHRVVSFSMVEVPLMQGLPATLNPENNNLTWLISGK